MQPDAGPSSFGVRSEPGLGASVLRFLDLIDELPRGATGALHFGHHGVVLLQSKKVCWAAAGEMRTRLTDILQNQRTPPVPRHAIEAVYRQCKGTGRPLGEMLVESGLVSEEGLKSALLLHTGESITHLARLRATPVSFAPHARSGYDPKYSFSTVEILASLGKMSDPDVAMAADAELGRVLVAESTGAAFVRSPATSGALVIAVDRACELPATELVGACNWAKGLFDVARTFDPTTWMARAVWGSRTTLVTWTVGDAGYLGLCASRAAAARLVNHLERRAGHLGDAGPASTGRDP